MDNQNLAVVIGKLAATIKRDAISSAYVQDGPRSHTPSQCEDHRARVLGYADELQELADRASWGEVNYAAIEAVLTKVRLAGFVPTISEVNEVAKIFFFSGA